MVHIADKNAVEQKRAAKEFAQEWKDKGYEKGEGQIFWLKLLKEVYGVEKPEDFIRFEVKVKFDKTNFIDGLIDETHVLIEQKSANIDLRKDTYKQAKKYSDDLPYNKKPRWIVLCNFKSFLIHDMNKPREEPEEILLEDLPKDYYRLSFLTDVKAEKIKKEQELSVKAGELVGYIYNAFSKQYKDIENEHSQKSLNELCVRLVFCLYAEDAGLFGEHSAFRNYLSKYKDLDQMRIALINLFKVLDQKEEERDPYIDEELSRFPYVNGGLFSNENIEIPKFTEEIRNLLLAKASDDFNWKEISPTIFGAVFESTLNPETRRNGGMHYTSIENIHKVIDPLFLVDLRKELDSIKKLKIGQRKKLQEFQDKIGALTFLDPACGSGNFLTETYISLRQMENEIIEILHKRQMALPIFIKVNINHFYGIEINDFAVSVAKTALWIAESQMIKKTEEIILAPINFLPLKSYINIVEGNALRIDWNDVVDKDKLKFIMGNPPFVGSSKLSEEQKIDRKLCFDNNGGELDYVACWYKKAAEFIQNTTIECAFVSTNSICQGQQVYPLWGYMLEKNININFAYTSFPWSSESIYSANVIVIIVSFSTINRKEKYLISRKGVKRVKNINAYLIDAENIIIKKQRVPINPNVPVVIKGIQPTDNGNLILNDEEKIKLISKEPNAKKWIRPFIAAKEYMEGINRWCLWLPEISPDELNKLPLIKERVRKCKEWREQQVKTGDAYKLRNIPHLMRPSSKFKEGQFIVIPRNTTSSRRYIPVGYCDKGCIPGDSTTIVNDSSLYIFGVLESNVHMAWTRTVCGRLGDGYRYASDVVYNTFPWCTPNKHQILKIEHTAQSILDARALYPNSSLSDLYDDITMPIALKKAHKQNDIAVMEAYGFNKNMTESEIISELMQIYQELIMRKK